MALCKNVDLNMTIDYSPRNETFIKNYNVDVQKLTENFSIDTECEFSCAYGYFLIGSGKRHCLPVSKWDGLQSTCKRYYKKFFSIHLKLSWNFFLEILCQSLPKIPFGFYNSQDCTDQKSSYGTNCTITCESGFEIKGPSLKTCGGTRNGAWSQKNKIPRCVDVTPPVIACPQNYSIGLNGNKSFVLLSEFKPLDAIKGKRYT